MCSIYVTKKEFHSNRRKHKTPPPNMPVLTRETLALKLRQNWLAKNPGDLSAQQNGALDDSLTSLNWLQNLNIMKITTPTPPASPQPQEQVAQPPLYTPATQVNPNAVLNMNNVPMKIKQEPGVSPPRIGAIMEIAPPMNPIPNGIDKIDYKTNPYVKPPYSYATLICMAMKETKKNKITLSGIYNWITENFMYYRVADPSWQNSIRHNLSLNKCFQKVPRRKDEPGKGGFWRINPEYEDMFINGIFKKRRGSTSLREPMLAPPLKKIKRENEDSNSSDSCGGTIHISVPDTTKQNTTFSNKLEIKKEKKDGSYGGLDDGFNDFNFNSILNQDIEVGGMSIKTEDIIDGGHEADVASPITALSPPPSEGSNSDIALDDLFGTADLGEFENHQCVEDIDNGQPLDLSVNGISLRPPEWWNDSFNGARDLLSNERHSVSGLHTPVHASPVPDTQYAHPWAEDKSDIDHAIACFDTDISHLFDIDNIPSPRLTADS